MHFPIGPRKYEVRRRWNLRCDGEVVDGLCSFSQRLIWIDAELPEDQVADVLFHECVHAWEGETARPRTDEERANFASFIAASFQESFESQGGLRAFLALPLEGTRPTPRKKSSGRAFGVCDRVTCGACGAEVLQGSICSDPMRLMDETEMSVIDRGFECPACENVQVWTERCTNAGFPMGEFYAPRMLGGDEATEWLRAHRVPELHLSA